MTTTRLALSPGAPCAGEAGREVGSEAEREFREFVAARTPALLRTAYLLVGGDWALAEDLLQTA